MADPQDIAEAAYDAMIARDRVFRLLGMRKVAVGPGTCVLELDVREDMLNGHDIGHGGIVFTLADTAFAVACNSFNRRAVAAGADITFVAAAEPGETLRASAEARVQRRRTGVYDITVTGRDDRMIALFRGKSHRLADKLVPDLPAADEDR